MAGHIFHFILVVAVSFVALVLLVSFFRFQNRVASAATRDETLAVGETPFTDLLAGHLASGPREPDPCLVVQLELENREALVSDLDESDRIALQQFMAGHVRARIRARDVALCTKPGHHRLLVLAAQGQAEDLVTRLAGAFQDDVFQPKAGAGIPLHVRVGAASCPEDGTGVAALLTASSEALDRAGDACPWALASRPEEGESGEDLSEDPLADVPASQRHLVDSTTGLLKEDHLGSTMQRFVARAWKREQDASIVCLAIDQFQGYRDLYGAEGSKALLAHLARILKHGVREEDLLARYGEGAFVLMLGCSPSQALHAVERIGRKVKTRPPALQGAEVPVRLTAGVAGCPEHGTVPSEIFKLALVALSYAGGEDRDPFLVHREGMTAQHAQHASRESF